MNYNASKPNTHQIIRDLPYSSERRCLISISEPINLKIVGSSKKDTEFFSDITDVREKTGNDWAEQDAKIDNYSDHYCIYIDNKPVGTLGVTRALHGDLFMEDFYPKELLENYHDRIVSAYRFRLLQQYHRTSILSGKFNLANVLIKEVWREQIQKGVSLDIINVEHRYINYYRRLGYVICEGYEFVCPIFKIPVYVMLLTTDPSRKSVVSDLIDEKTKPLFLDDCIKLLNKNQIYFNKNLASA